MATKLYFNETQTTPVLAGPAVPRDLISSVPTGSQNIGSSGTITAGSTEWRIPQGVTFQSERVASEFTLSGNITCGIWAHEIADIDATLRVKVYKVVRGGSNTETLIAQGDLSGELSTTRTFYTFTITPSVPITIAVDERFVVRVYVVPVVGLTLGSGVVQLYYGGTNAQQSDSYIELSETVTLKPNGTQLYLRRTTASGIGTFYDMLTTRGVSAFTSGVVNTAAGATEIQWTRTAGGTVLEWVSPPIANTFYFSNPTTAIAGGTLTTWAFESNALANVTIRWRIYRRRGTTEVACMVGPALTAELGTTIAQKIITTLPTNNPQITNTEFMPDDRIVLRMYLSNVGTMAAGYTVTMHYDHNVAAVDGDSFLSLYEVVEFKAEGDPLTPASIPGGMPMGGVGN